MLFQKFFYATPQRPFVLFYREFHVTKEAVLQRPKPQPEWASINTEERFRSKPIQATTPEAAMEEAQRCWKNINESIEQRDKENTFGEVIIYFDDPFLVRIEAINCEFSRAVVPVESLSKL